MVVIVFEWRNKIVINIFNSCSIWYCVFEGLLWSVYNRFSWIVLNIFINILLMRYRWKIWNEKEVILNLIF